MKKFEASLLDSGEFMRRAGLQLINNAGRAIAIITLVVAALVTFTDLSFAGFGAESFTETVLIMLIASYLIYFSMEDTGEKTGTESPEYKATLEEYNIARDKVSAENIDALREFCTDYSAAEHEFRINSMLITYGESRERYNAYLSGDGEFSKRSIRAFKRASRLKAIPLSPKVLLSREHSGAKSELSNPEDFKILRLIAKLVPTTVCMLLTISIIPTAKDMSVSTVIEGILKLSSLPIIGLRGFIAGYRHVKERRGMWLETKTRLLCAFTAKGR